MKTFQTHRGQESLQPKGHSLRNLLKEKFSNEKNPRGTGIRKI